MATNHEDKELYRIAFSNGAGISDRKDVLANNIKEAIDIANDDLVEGDNSWVTKAEQISDGWILLKEQK